eukprot:gene7034-14304_t
MNVLQNAESKIGSSKLSVILLGGSGHLSLTKLIPSIFDIYNNGDQVTNFSLISCGRRNYTTHSFREVIEYSLQSLYDNNDNMDKIQSFLGHCEYYCFESYSSISNINHFITEFLEKNIEINSKLNRRLFYFALPPSQTDSILEIFASNGLLKNIISNNKYSSSYINDYILEKPLGKDLKSCNKLIELLHNISNPSNIWLIDHYLGKDMIRGILPFRATNPIFEYSFNKDVIEFIHIEFKEPNLILGRSGYFDEYGIIRDIIQNHLLQILSLITMDIINNNNNNNNDNNEFIRSLKLNLLKSIKSIEVEDCIIGQYKGYIEEDGISSTSSTPTYARCILYINSTRWDGVPIILSAGKGIESRAMQIRIKYKSNINSNNKNNENENSRRVQYHSSSEDNGVDEGNDGDNAEDKKYSSA